MYNPIEVNAAAKKALNMLTVSKQVAYEKKCQYTVTPVNVDWNGNALARLIDAAPRRDYWGSFIIAGNPITISVMEEYENCALVQLFMDEFQIGGSNSMYMFVYSDGATMTAPDENGELITVELPPAGIYVVMTDQQLSDGAVIEWTELATKEDHTIDPKFLPKGGVGYEESDSKEILAIEDRNFSYGGEAEAISFPTDAAAYTLGHMNNVYWDGVWHECETKQRFKDDGTVVASQVVFGNVGRQFAGNSDTGEPFLFVLPISGTMYGEIAVFAHGDADIAASTHTWGIFDKDETIHTIDPKFIPGVTIDLADYGVDLFTLFMSGGGTSELTNADKLKELVNNDHPVTLIVQSLGAKVTADMAKQYAYDEISVLCASIPLFVNGGYYVLHLYVDVGLASVKLIVTSVG